MKKIYSSILFVLAFTALGAQTTIFESDYDEASYDAAPVQANLNDHPDWLAGHNNGTSIWQANTNDQILTGANFAWSVLQTPITGTVNDVITVTTVIMLGFDNQNWDGTDTDMALVALTPGNPTPGPGGSTAILGQQRDGVIIKALAASTSSVDLTNAGGTGSFSSDITITNADKAAYEIIMEFNIGADAASSSKEVRLRNLGSGVTSTTVTSNGMRQQVYDALTGSGAFYFNWALGFFQGGDEINRIVNNRVKITRNDPVLSTNKNNAFEFGIYPNPVNKKLHINTQEAIKKVEVLDLLGRQVLFQENVFDAVDVSSLKSALYIVRLTSDRGVSTRKFIKK